jgi:hypothetical protein
MSLVEYTSTALSPIDEGDELNPGVAITHDKDKSAYGIIVSVDKETRVCSVLWSRKPFTDMYQDIDTGTMRDLIHAALRR